MPEPSVAAGLMDAVFEFAVSKGADRQALADAARFKPGQAAPDDRLPYDAYVSMFRCAKRLTGDPALALRFGEEVDMSQFSVVGLLGPPPGSAGEVIDYFNRYARLLIDVPGQSVDRLRLGRAGSSLWLVDARPDPNRFPELTESTFARMVCTARKMGVQSPIAELHVTHAKPLHDEQYDRIFAVPIRFGAAWNAVRFGDELLRLLPAGVQLTYAQRLASGHAEKLLDRLMDEATFRGRVASEIERAIRRGKATINMVSSQLGMSRQTLYRHLKREGLTYQELHDEIRCRIAVNDLGSGRPIAQVAHQLGFSDRAAFSRAFRRWTGRSPGAGRSA